MIAPVLLNGRWLMPPGKANCGVGSRDSDGCHQQAVNCNAIAAVRLGRQQPGILSSQKLPRSLI
jgi:hypothetical protein